MSEQKQIMQILETCQALFRDGHFKLYGQLHSKGYANVRLALAQEKYAEKISKKLVKNFLKDKIDVVVGFTIGGIVLATYVAKGLKKARPVAARIVDDRVEFFAASRIRPGENVLIVDDVLRPPLGKPINQVLLAIRNTVKGNVVGIGVVVDRTTKRPKFKDGKIRIVSLARLEPKGDFQIWSPDFCPECRKATPLVDYSEVDRDPLTLLFWLPEEKYKVFLVALLKHVIRAWKDERLLKEIDSLDQPISEFPGVKSERVAILGATEGLGASFMNELAKFIASLQFHGITSRYLYLKGTAEKRKITHSKREGMIEFLQRMIQSCQYVILVHNLPGGQFIETVWCSHLCKPTLGYIPIRDWSPDSPKPCEYLVYIPEKKLVVCNGFRAIEEDKEEVMGWICVRNKTCPLVASQNIPKMIPDLFMSSKRMFLVGSLASENLSEVCQATVRDFLQNNGKLEYLGHH